MQEAADGSSAHAEERRQTGGGEGKAAEQVSHATPC